MVNKVIYIVQYELPVDSAADKFGNELFNIGVFAIQPYKDELLPLWRISTIAAATESSNKIYEKFVLYRDGKDFVGTDLAVSKKGIFCSDQEIDWTRFYHRENTCKWDLHVLEGT